MIVLKDFDLKMCFDVIYKMRSKGFFFFFFFLETFYIVYIYIWEEIYRVSKI
jgi:hypothetical protein